MGIFDAARRTTLRSTNSSSSISVDTKMTSFATSTSLVATESSSSFLARRPRRFASSRRVLGAKSRLRHAKIEPSASYASGSTPDDDDDRKADAEREQQQQQGEQKEEIENTIPAEFTDSKEETSASSSTSSKSPYQKYRLASPITFEPLESEKDRRKYPMNEDGYF